MANPTAKPIPLAEVNDGSFLLSTGFGPGAFFTPRHQVSTRNSHTRTELPRSRATTTMTSPDSPASAAAVSGHSGWPVNRTLDDQLWWTQQPISGASFSWCPAAASRRISGVTAAGRTAVVRGGQRRAALEDLRGSRGAADESPRGFVEASVVGSSHRLRLELSIICASCSAGGMLGGDHPAASAPTVRSPRPTDAKRPRIKHSTQARATGHNRQFIGTHRYARPLETAARRSKATERKS